MNKPHKPLLALALLLAGLLHAQTAPGRRVTASSDSEEFPAAAAFDGDLQTRWSSAFNDGEWWQVEFAEPRALGGLLILWEHAFAENYHIEVSDDGLAWRTVFEETKGDGGTDRIHFAPLVTRHLRLHAVERATAWGVSVWEILFLAPEDCPAASADNSLSDSPPALALDGSMDTAWRSEPVAQASFSVRFPAKVKLAGAKLYWGEDYAKAFTVHAWTDADTQVPVHLHENGNGELDYIVFDETNTDRLDFVFKESALGHGFELRELRFTGPDEKTSPVRQFVSQALDGPKSRYPLWLSREQEFWTLTGVPGESAKSLLGETGTFEPAKRAFTVMPFLLEGTKLTTWEDATLRQELLEGDLPLPRVVWDHPDWSLEIAPLTFGEPNRNGTLVRYRVGNKGRTTRDMRLGFSVMPVQLNPDWQHGGLSPIRQARWREQDRAQALYVNDQARLLAQPKPLQVAVLPFDQGSAVYHLAKGILPNRLQATDPEGCLSAALLYDLRVPPGESQDVFLFYPLQRSSPREWPWEDSAAEFERQEKLARDKWREILDRVRIEIPEPNLVRVMKSNLAYLLIARDGPWFKPGTRFYNNSWIRDGALIGLSLMQLGQIDPVVAYAEACEDTIHSNGWVPWIVHENGKPVAFNKDSRENHEYDSQGQFAFLARAVYEYTRDRDWLEDRYDAVRKSLEFGLALRRERMTPEYKDGPYYGLLPESNSHEGYYPAMHSYWDNYWLLRGLADGAWIAEVLGHEEDSLAWRAEAESYRRDVLASIERVVARDGLDYLPGCVEKGDFDPTSSSIAFSACDEKGKLPEHLVRGTFDRYYEEFIRRLLPGGRRTYSPYEARNAQAYVKRGEPEKALNILRFLAADAVLPAAWNSMAEVVHVRPRVPAYVGDMPHGWVGSEFISALRSLFAFEEGGRLVIAAGLAPDWWRQGTSVAGLPTAFGPIDYTVRFTPGIFDIEVTGAAQPPDGFEIPLPTWILQAKVDVNDAPVEVLDGKIRFPTLPARIRIQFTRTMK